MSVRRKKPLQVGKARTRAQRCLRQGSYRLSVPHLVKERMRQRDIIVSDLLNVVMSKNAKITHEWNKKYEEWRYCFSTKRFKAWITFEVPSRLVFITARRLKRNP